MGEKRRGEDQSDRLNCGMPLSSLHSPQLPPPAAARERSLGRQELTLCRGAENEVPVIS